MTIIDSILAKIGLMKVGEHLAWVNLAADGVEQNHARENALRAEIDALRPDAEKFRAKRDRDNAGRRERRARNATGAQKSGPARAKKVAG